MGLFDAVGDLLGTNKTSEALAAQQASSAEAARIQKQMYDQSREDLQPYREAGYKALGGMQDADYSRDFTMADFTKDPGYQFRMDEGQKALERSAAARGALSGGATLKGLTQYGQNFASNEYNNAYNRFNADRDRRFGRLSSLAGLGSSANAQGVQANQVYGQGASDIATGLGNAQAAAYINQGNQNAAMFNGILGTGATALKMCDKRLKTDIKEVSKQELQEMKDCLKAYRFKYKDEKHGAGDHIGVMAQDLEKSKLGKTLVVENEDGHKMIDIGRVMMLFLATMAEA